MNEGTDRRNRMAKSFHIGNEPPPLTDRPTDDFTELIQGTASLDIYILCNYKTNNRPTEILCVLASLNESLSVSWSIRKSFRGSVRFSKIMNKRLSEKAENNCGGRESYPTSYALSLSLSSFQPPFTSSQSLTS